jgi:predicted dehydrogenase
VLSTRWRATELSGLGIVVVGTGFGARVHVRAFRAAGFTVRALVGRDPGRTARRAERLGVRGLTSVDDALGLPDVDAVSIATPPHHHHRLVLDAIAARKHVVCEKPFALDAVQAREMAVAADRAGVIGFVGHEFRWATERALVARVIAEGRIGEPRLATLVSYVGLLADPVTPAPDWWFDPARGGGWLGASGSHAIDQVRAWLGDVEGVYGRLSMTSARDAVGGAVDSFTALLDMASGAHVVVQQTAGAWGPMADVARVAGTEGTVWIADGRVWLAEATTGATGRAQCLDVPDDLALPPAPPASADPRRRFTHLELGPYTRLAEAFAARVRGLPSPSPVEPATFADGVACMEVLDRLR